MSIQPNNADYVICDFSDPLHLEHLTELISHYMTDPMGDSPVMDNNQKQNLIEGLRSHSNSFVLFILYRNEIAGLATCFVNFSTFKAKPYINIHDLIVYKHLRHKGLGRKLLDKIIQIASERDYCKVTLEVRDDNKNAKIFYQSLGFKDTEPLMHFWTKTL